MVDNFRPKGGMCMTCKRCLEDCSSLPFHEMKVLKRDGEDVTVICSDYERRVNGEENIVWPR